jgi:hypothetical protein
MSLHMEMVLASKPEPSSVVMALLSMDQGDRDAVLAAMADAKVKSKAIQKVLNKNGYGVSYDAVRRFRAKKVHIPAELDF